MENPSDVQDLPTLSVQSGGDGTLRVSWPATKRAVALEFTSALVPLVDWQTVTGVPPATNGLVSLTLPIPYTSSPRFYRLRGEP